MIVVCAVEIFLDVHILHPYLAVVYVAECVGQAGLA